MKTRLLNLLSAHYRLSSIDCLLRSLLPAHYRLSSIDYRLSTIVYRLLASVIIACTLSSIDYRLSTAYAGQLKFDGAPVDITTSNNEDLVVAPGSGGNTQIGDTSGTNTNAVSNDDLYITGVQETDGAAYFDSILTVSAAATLNGAVSLGDATSDTLTATGRFGSHLIPSADSTYSLGSSTLAWSNLYVDTISGYNSALSLSPASGYSLAGAVTKNTATGNEVAYDLAATINKATSGNYTGLKLNVTETSAPGTADRLLDLLVNGTSRLQVYNGANSANYGLLSVGADDWDGSTPGFFAGSALGTQLAINALSGFSGNLIDAQVAGNSKFSVDVSGNVVASGTIAGSGTLGGSGTANFLPKWSAATTLANSLLYDNGTNVGIGTTGASGRLQVTGDEVRIGDSGTVDKASADGDLYIEDALEVDGVSYLAGNVGIGTTAPGAKLEVQGNSASSIELARFQNVGSNDNSYIFFPRPSDTTRGLIIGHQSTGVNVSWIRASGSVSENMDIQAGLDASSVRGKIVLQPSGGNVGIGTISPAQKLHVEGQCVTGDTLLPIVNQVSQEITPSTIHHPPSTIHHPPSTIHSIPITDVKPGDYVLSLNEQTGQIEPHRINGLLDMGVKPVFRLTTEDGRTIRTTGNHPYLVKGNLTDEKREAIAKARVKSIAQKQALSIEDFSTEKEFSQARYVWQDSGRGNLITYLAMVDVSDGDSIRFPENKFNAVIANTQPEFLELSTFQLNHLSMLEGMIELADFFNFSDDARLFFNRKAGQFLFRGGVKEIIEHRNGYLDDFSLFSSRLSTSLAGIQEPLRSAAFTRASVSLTDSCEDNSMKSTTSSKSSLERTLDGASTPRRFLSSMIVKCRDLFIHKKYNTFLNNLSRKNWESYLGVAYASIPDFKAEFNANWLKVLYLKAGDEIAVVDNGQNPPSIHWSRIASIEFSGYEQVYDIEVEGTHNFIAGHWLRQLDNGSWIMDSGHDPQSTIHNPQSSAKRMFGGIVAHNTYISSNLGIGTTAPAAKLDIVDSSTNGKLLFQQAGDGNLQLLSIGDHGSPNDGYARYGAWIDSAGFVVTNNYNPSSSAADGDASETGTEDYTSRMGLQFLGLSAGVAANSYYDFAFAPAGAGIQTAVSAMRVLGSGNIGIGTTTPAAKLDVLATAEQLRLKYDPTNYSSFTVNSTGDLTIAPSGGDTSVTGNLAVSGTQTFTGNTTITGDLAVNGSTTLGDNTGAAETLTLNADTLALLDAAKTISLANVANSLNIDSDTLTIDALNNRVGIGTTGPSQKLDVNGNIRLSASQGNIQFEGTGDYIAKSNSNILLRAINGIDFAVTDGLAIKMSILSNGNVGIGTTGPGTKLDISGSGGNTLRLTSTDNDASLQAVSASGFDSYLDLLGGTATRKWTVGNDASDGDKLKIGTGTPGIGTLVTITTTGLVGIGTTGPSDNLHISESDAGTNTILTNLRQERLTSGAAAAGLGVAQDFYLEDAAGNSNQAARIDVAWEDATNLSEDASIRFNQMVAGTLTEAMRIDDAGNVGIGTTAPGNKLTVHTANGADDTLPALGANGGKFALLNNPVNAYGLLQGVLGNGNAFLQAQRVDGAAIAYSLLLNPNGGNLGIGTTAPGAKLQVAGGAIRIDENQWLDTPNISLIKQNYFGANSAQKTIQIGTNKSISFGVDTSAITGSNYSSSNELIVSNAFTLRNVNSAGTDFIWSFQLSNGWLGLGGIAPNDRELALNGDGADTIRVGRNTNGNAPGTSLTIKAGGATSGATNKDGGTLILSGGIPTGTGTSQMQFQTATAGASGTTDGAPDTKMTILGSGNVGIGTTNPSTPLHILTADNATAQTITINAAQASVTALDTFIDFRSTTGSEGSIAGTASAGVLAYNTFTGSHWTVIDDREGLEPNILLEIIEGKIGPQGQLFKTRICETKASPSAIGVWGGQDKEGRDMVLSLGTGYIWVVNKGKDLEIGDYLISSDVSGCVELQEDNLYRSVTVAKATEKVKWNEGEARRLISCIYLGG